MTSRRTRTRDEAVARAAERALADTRFDRLRSRRARIAIVVILGLLLVLIPVTFIVAGSLAGTGAVVVAALGWSTLRISVRTIADLPDQQLDERQLAIRNQAYVDAYRWLASLVVALGSAGLLAFIILGKDPDTWTINLTWDAAFGVFWLLMGAVLSFPSMSLALRDREHRVD